MPQEDSTGGKSGQDEASSSECFVIMPITVRPATLERYGGNESHFTDVFESLFSPAIEGSGLTPKSPVREGSENIQAAIINDLVNAALVLVDLSCLNANVFFELGIRTALNKPVCLVWDGLDSLPFDTGTINTHKYKPVPGFALNGEIEGLRGFIDATLAAAADGKNALWKYFGTAVGPLESARLDPEYSTSDAKLDVLLARVNSLAERLPRQQRRIEGGRGRNHEIEELPMRVFQVAADTLSSRGMDIDGVTVELSEDTEADNFVVSVKGPPPSLNGRPDPLKRSLERNMAAMVGRPVEIEIQYRG